MKIRLIALALLCFVAAKAQDVSTSTGGFAPFFQKKQSKEFNFLVGGNNYFFNYYFESAQKKYHLTTYNSSGDFVAASDLKIEMGVFNNSFSIDQVVAVGSKVYATVEHLDKPSGKMTLSAREISPNGEVSTNETVLSEYAFTKTLNSGQNETVVSPDGKTLAVVSLLPFVKKQSAKVKVSVYDESLKQISTGQITIPGEDKKNKRIEVQVANDGTVYIVKHTSTGKLGISLESFNVKGGKIVGQHKLGIPVDSRIFSYVLATNMKSELVICGSFYNSTKVVVNGQKVHGVFYYNSSASKLVMSDFDTPIVELTVRKVLFAENTIYVGAESYNEEKMSPPPSSTGSAATFDYNYMYNHSGEYVIGLDNTGKKKFELNLDQSGSIKNFDQVYRPSFVLSNNDLICLYNDHTEKYITNYDWRDDYDAIMPVLVKITEDGLMLPPVVFKDDLKNGRGSKYYPSVSLQKSANELNVIQETLDMNLKRKFIFTTIKW